jgi:tetratricopeptide (TPR) repeat protein
MENGNVRERMIIILCVVGLLAGFYVAWVLANRRGKRRRQTRNSSASKSNRSGDQRILTSMERQIIDRAKELVGGGHCVQASQLLEQVGLHREAISLLEDKKYFDEAAAILLRLQKPNRVGVLYARNGLWAKAAPFFIQAGQNLEAAKAYREAGLFKEAAELFQGEQSHSDAATCYEQVGLFQEAARCWSRASKHDAAINCWDKFGLVFKHSSHESITESEYKLIARAVTTDQAKKGLVALIARSPMVTICAVECVKAGFSAAAKEILRQASAEHYLDIIADTSLDSSNGKVIAEILSCLEHHKLAANLFERHGYFAQAADAYAAAGDEDRARYCVSRQNPGKSVGQSQPATTKSLSSSSSSTPSQFFIEPTKHNLPIPQSWLLKDLPADICGQLMSRFRPLDITSGQTITSGSAEAKLVYVIRGELKSNVLVASDSEWAGVEDALADKDSIHWTALRDTSVVVITAAEFYDLFNKNGSLARIVYRNLTLRLQNISANQPTLKAI